MRRRVVLLSDEPADADHFAGAHGRVASALAELIGSETGGKAVALEGTWGAGKSTVVGLLAAQLAALNDRDHLVVVFDAWAHQGDPLRRSFLETVLEQLRLKDWIQEKDWNEVWKNRAAELAGSRTESVVTTTPRLTTAGKVLAVAAGATPLGLVLLNAVLGSNVKGWQLLGSLALTLSVFIAVAALWGARSVAKSPNRKRDLDPLSPLASSAVRDELTTTYESGEPTSIEFEGFFRDLAEAALTNSGRKLVVVLDNLDRVDMEGASAILATLQTFRPDRSRSWSSRLWTIIPFDSEGLRKLWQGAGVSQVVGSDEVAGEFLDKLFDVTFHVPPLIVSNWHRFLNEQMELGLPDITSDERRAIAALYSAWMLDTQEGRSATPARTPRALKRFVNEVGAALRSNDELACSAAAAFVLLRRANVDVLASLLEGRGMSRRMKALLGPQWRAQIAGAYFGTSPDNGLQLLLDAPIRDALLDGDEATLEQLAGIPGFFEVLTHCHIETWADSGAIRLMEAAATLARSRVAEAPGAEATVSAMVGALLSSESWPLANERSGAGLAFLLGRGVAKGVISVDEATKRLVIGDLGEFEVEATVDGQYSALAAVADSLAGANGQAARPIVHRGTAGEFIDLCGRLGANASTTALWPLLRSREDATAVASAMSALLTAPPDAFSIDQLLDVLLMEPSRVDLAAAASAFGEWFTGDVADQTLAQQALTILERLARLEPSPATAILERLRSEGQLLHAAYTADQQGSPANAAVALLLHVTGLPALPAPPADRNNAEGHALAASVFATPESHAEIIAIQAQHLVGPVLPRLHAVVDANPSAIPWGRAVLAEIIKNSPDSVTNADLVHRWSRYVELTDQATLDSLIAERVLRGGMLDSLCTEPPPAGWDEIAAAATRAIDSAEEGDATDSASTQLDAWMSGVLEGLDQAAWHEALSTEPLHACKLVVWLAVRGHELQLGLDLETALRQHATAVAAGEGVPALASGEWNTILVALRRQDARQNLARALVGIAASANGGVPAARFWDLYGDLLRDEPSARRHDRLVPEVIEPIITNRDARGLDWAATTVEADPDLLGSSGEQRDRIARLIADAIEQEVDDSPVAGRLGQLRASVERGESA